MHYLHVLTLTDLSIMSHNFIFLGFFFFFFRPVIVLCFDSSSKFFVRLVLRASFLIISVKYCCFLDGISFMRLLLQNFFFFFWLSVGAVAV